MKVTQIKKSTRRIYFSVNLCMNILIFFINSLIYLFNICNKLFPNDI